MLSRIVALVLIAAVVGFGYVHSRTLSEKDVRTFYEQTDHEIGMRNPDGLCAQLAEHFEGNGVTISPFGREKQAINKTEACDSYHEMFKGFEVAGDRLGGIVQLDYRRKILDIRLSPDKHSAKVDMVFQMDVAGSLMNIRSTSTDTLIKRGWITLVETSEYKTVVNGRF